jgi:SAM-dependent methyltransferase
MTDPELLFHYQQHGREEGRVCSQVRDRQSFLKIMPADARILEIGPFWGPAFTRPLFDVAYIDAYDREELQRRAERDPNSGGAMVPEIDYVWQGQPYENLINVKFDVAYSSHNIEHQPDLIRHLRDVASVLRPGGVFALVIPDKRYCFDHFLSSSDITDIMEGYMHRRTRHSMAKVIADKMMHTHNDPLRHWLVDHGRDPRYEGPSEYRKNCIIQGMAYYENGKEYIDAHAWHFTPDTFGSIIEELFALNISPFDIKRIYPTVFGSFEFYALLHKRP